MGTTVGLGEGVGDFVGVAVGVGVGVTVGVGVFVGVAVGCGVGVTVGMPVLVGSGFGVPLATRTKVTNAITITAARALTMIQGSFEEAAGVVGDDTRTPHRNSLRWNADLSFSLSLERRCLNGGAGASLGGASIVWCPGIHHATAQNYFTSGYLFECIRCRKAIHNRH
jgi:hypothetical protein